MIKVRIHRRRQVFLLVAQLQGRRAARTDSTPNQKRWFLHCVEQRVLRLWKAKIFIEEWLVQQARPSHLWKKPRLSLPLWWDPQLTAVPSWIPYKPLRTYVKQGQNMQLVTAQPTAEHSWPTAFCRGKLGDTTWTDSSHWAWLECPIACLSTPTILPTITYISNASPIGWIRLPSSWRGGIDKDTVHVCDGGQRHSLWALRCFQVRRLEHGCLQGA